MSRRPCCENPQMYFDIGLVGGGAHKASQAQIDDWVSNNLQILPRAVQLQVFEVEVEMKFDSQTRERDPKRCDLT